MLGSIRFVDDMDVHFEPFWEGKTVYQAERRYLEAALECVRIHDGFDVMSRLTYIGKTQGQPSPRPVAYADHRELIDEILPILSAGARNSFLSVPLVAVIAVTIFVLLWSQYAFTILPALKTIPRR